MQTLAKRLTWARKAAAISQRSLARRAKLASERHIGLIESGDRDNPELKTLEAIAGALGVAVGWLASGEGPKPTAEQIKSGLADEPPDEDGAAEKGAA